MSATRRIGRRRSRLALLSWAALSALACSGDSPTAAPPANPGPDGLTIAFPDGLGALAPREAAIRELIAEAYVDAAKVISVQGVTISVSANSATTIPGWGVGGSAHRGAMVEIGIDPALSGALLAERLPSMASHELHHFARARGPGYGVTLLEAMVAEGLADHFALERLGQPPPPWTMALTPAQNAAWLDRARLELDSPGYDHAAWFFGSTQMPRWIGYTLGFELVGDYQAAHSGASAAALVNTPAEAFRPR